MAVGQQLATRTPLWKLMWVWMVEGGVPWLCQGMPRRKQVSTWTGVATRDPEGRGRGLGQGTWCVPRQ